MDLNPYERRRRDRRLVIAAKQGNRDLLVQFLNQGVDVNTVANNTTALAAAAGKGHKDIVSLLLDRGADVNIVVRNTTALLSAAGKGHKDTVLLLLDRGADVNMVVNNTTALLSAVGQRQKDIVLLLLDRGADINMVVNNTTALVMAVGRWNKDIVLLLLDRGADVNRVVGNTTALLSAAGGGHKDIVSLLLDRGADVNMVVRTEPVDRYVSYIRSYRTALVIATEKGHVDTVSTLLDRGADMNMGVWTEMYDYPYKNGYRTAWLLAVERGHKNVVSLLLDRGADVDIVVDNTTALLSAVEKGHDDIVSTLLDRGADVNKVVRNTTALVRAIGRGKTDLVFLLLDRGANINMVVDGTTALMKACSYWLSGSWNINITLLRSILGRSRVADVDKIAHDPVTKVYVLMMAAWGGHKGIVLLLLDRGADVNMVVYKLNTTALISAAGEGHKDTVLLLLDRRAGVSMVANNINTTGLLSAVGERHKDTVLLLLDGGAHDPVTKVYVLMMAAWGGHKDIVSLLLDRAADVNMVVNNTTALLSAAGEGHKDTVLLLLDRGADVNMVVDNATALLSAAGKGHKDTVLLLLDRGADVNIVVDNGTTALLRAAGEGHKDTVLLLLDRGADVNMVVNNTTALLSAAGGGHKDTVLLLLDQGADVNMVVNYNNTTALLHAAQKGHKDTVLLLLDRGVDANIVVDALLWAVGEGHKDTVLLLLDLGADVNMVVNNTTALVLAAGRGQKDTVLLLLDRGADVNMVVNNTMALVRAMERGQKDIVSLLLDRGADVNMVVNNTTALVRATERGQKDIVSLLLDRGADMNMVTPLVVAAEQGHSNLMLLFLSRGADVNMVFHDTTALVAAVRKRRRRIVKVLLRHGADVNMVVHDTTALAVAVGKWHEGSSTGGCVATGRRDLENIMRQLLDRGADVNMVVHDPTALVAAVKKGDKDTVSLLLDIGAPVDMVAYDTTALIAAAENGHKDIVSLLLDKGAAVNMIVHDTTALIAIIATGISIGHASIEIVRLLLDRGADLNMVAGQYGTALVAAICACHDDHLYRDNMQLQPALLSMLLNHNPDVSIVAGDYGTALTAAIFKLQFPEQVARNQSDTVQSSGWQWIFLDRLLSSVYLPRDHYNLTVGKHGTPLAIAISKGNLQLLRLLVERGGDVGSVGDSCGIALRAASATGWESQRLYNMLRYLVDEGADINVVSSQQFGSALGQAAYKGDMGLVSFLLGCGADPFHVGGTHYRAALEGAYPSALDAALSLGSKPQSAPDLGLVTELSKVIEASGHGDLRKLQRSPPFPMPHTRPSATRLSGAMQSLTAMAGDSSGSSTCSGLESICDLPAYAALTTQQANISCATLKEELIVKVLVQLVISAGTDTDAPELKRYGDWIRNDVRYFITQGYDFGEAYAAARVGWRHFNKLNFVRLVEQHRGQWLDIAQEIDKDRVNSIYACRDKTNPRANQAKVQERIKLPYQVMPRRLWDLKSNRVVEFRMLQSELLAYKSTSEQRFGKARAKFQASHSSEVPVYWAISHSWEGSMDPLETPINQYQWPVPLPHKLDLEHDVRQELLSYGIEYVWLDVLCLRQQAVLNSNCLNSQIPGPAALDEATKEEAKKEEWKLDVPTIGNIYRVAQGIVRYFNGLGRPFSPEGWDGERHWLQRAWTLQEIKTEDSTINGSTGTANVMNICGMVARQTMTLRRAIRPVLKLAEDADSTNGCSLYALVREMSQRKATKSTDKVAGLVYLLRLTELPTYDEKAKDDDVWATCFHMLPLARKIELLFNFPYRSRSETAYWFPTWSELMMWPEVNPDCDYSLVRRTEGPGIGDLVDLTESEEAATEGSLFMSDIWALSQCHVARGLVDYDVTVKTASMPKVYGFYGPYVSQEPIETSSEGQQCEFTIVTAGLGNSNNWVVCKLVKKLKARYNPTSRLGELGLEEKTDGSSNAVQPSGDIEIEVLKKVGVLRTDSCGVMLAGVGARGDSSALRKIHALFI